MGAQAHAELATEQIGLLLRAALDRAVQLGAQVTVAVVDRGGETCGLLRMQGAHSGAASIAVDKAWTSVSFGGQSTRVMSQQIATFPPHALAILASRARYTPLTGALPLRLAGALVGAVGVAGATPEHDEECARAACLSIGAEA